MKLYINLKEMFFDDGVGHRIISSVSIEKSLYYDVEMDISDNDKFIKDTMRINYKKDEKGNNTDEIESIYFVIKEQKTWWSFPLYEVKDGKIIDFDYTQFKYFSRTDRRMALADKINNRYHPSSQIKILRKTLKYIMDNLKLNYPDEFSIMDKKIIEIIEKNPKDKIK